MPIYEYECAKCGKLSEVFQKVSDPDPEACASCGGKGTLSKIVSRTSFQLKGGGWYADLYSSTPKGGAKDGSSKSESSTGSDSKAG
ncbi:MAG TPA: zinc ribbon domain-containing protein [Vulgatibacter sp.]|nr:zinc ribbon domain-containing protein [Vulgatibacter sp.]